jgi:hypothetical protein
VLLEIYPFVSLLVTLEILKEDLQSLFLEEPDMSLCKWPVVSDDFLG